MRRQHEEWRQTLLTCLGAQHSMLALPTASSLPPPCPRVPSVSAPLLANTALLRAPRPALPKRALCHYRRLAALFLNWPAARLEAVIDFGEDEGIADDVAAGVVPLVAALRQRLQGHLAAAASGELVR